MKSIISINKKFMEFSPLELVNIIEENSKMIKGFEVLINPMSEFELKYLKDLAFICKKRGLHFQVHGDSGLALDMQISYLKELEKISDELGYPINVVLHSLNCDNHKESILKTIIYMDEIIKNSDSNKVIISLENLNDYNDDDRLNKEDITSIILNNEKLYMTYDIGHEIIENGKITDLNPLLIPKLSNIHIHTFNNVYSGGYDHKPIYKNDEHWNMILKGITFLKLNKYNGNIVFEYDVYACYGNNLKDKIISYCQSIDSVSNKLD